MVQSFFEALKSLLAQKSYNEVFGKDKNKNSTLPPPDTVTPPAPDSSGVNRDKPQKLDPKKSDEKLIKENRKMLNVSDSTMEQTQPQQKDSLNLSALPKAATDLNENKARQPPPVRSGAKDENFNVNDSPNKSFGKPIFNKFVQNAKDVATSDKPPGNFKIHRAIEMTKNKVLEPMKTDYAKKLAKLSPQEIYDNYNPVGSPCGNEFRKAIICQKSASEDEMACADEFIQFMECAIKNKCFRLRDANNKEGADS